MCSKAKEEKIKYVYLLSIAVEEGIRYHVMIAGTRSCCTHALPAIAELILAHAPRSPFGLQERTQVIYRVLLPPSCGCNWVRWKQERRKAGCYLTSSTSSSIFVNKPLSLQAQRRTVYSKTNKNKEPSVNVRNEKESISCPDRLRVPRLRSAFSSAGDLCDAEASASEAREAESEKRRAPAASSESLVSSSWDAAALHRAPPAEALRHPSHRLERPRGPSAPIGRIPSPTRPAVLLRAPRWPARPLPPLPLPLPPPLLPRSPGGRVRYIQ